jgi:hypothetical protein
MIRVGVDVDAFGTRAAKSGIVIFPQVGIAHDARAPASPNTCITRIFYA